MNEFDVKDSDEEGYYHLFINGVDVTGKQERNIEVSRRNISSC